MSPSETRHYMNCPCCGDPVVRIYNPGTGTGSTHFCNSVIYDSPEEKKVILKTTFKNSAFFDKYKRSNVRSK